MRRLRVGHSVIYRAPGLGSALFRKIGGRSFLIVVSLGLLGLSLSPIGPFVLTTAGDGAVVQQSLTADQFKAPTIYGVDGSRAGIVPFVIRTTVQRPTPIGDVTFGLMNYRTRDGDSCWDVAVANHPALISHTDGGFCSSGPMDSGNHIRLSWGTEVITARDQGTGGSSTVKLPFTSAGGEISSSVTRIIVTMDAHKFVVEPVNGGFLFVVPGLHRGPATVKALNHLGAVIESVEIPPSEW